MNWGGVSGDDFTTPSPETDWDLNINSSVPNGRIYCLYYVPKDETITVYSGAYIAQANYSRSHGCQNNTIEIGYAGNGGWQSKNCLSKDGYIVSYSECTGKPIGFAQYNGSSNAYKVITAKQVIVRHEIFRSSYSNTRNGLLYIPYNKYLVAVISGSLNYNYWSSGSVYPRLGSVALAGDNLRYVNLQTRNMYKGGLTSLYDADSGDIGFCYSYHAKKLIMDFGGGVLNDYIDGDTPDDSYGFKQVPRSALAFTVEGKVWQYM